MNVDQGSLADRDRVPHGVPRRRPTRPRAAATSVTQEGGTVMCAQRAWQRIILLTVLGYEGLGALVGASLLVAKPDGQHMKLPVAVMHGTFRDFLIPGIILFGLGVLAVAAFIGVLRKSRVDWLGAGICLGGFMIWFLVEILVVRELHWLHAMWGLPVILGVVVAVPLLPFRAATIRDAWLACGIVSSLFYVAMNIIVPRGWPGYDSASQVVSELSAIGAPTRPLWVALAMFYTLLVTAFGWGVRLAAEDDGRLRVSGTLVAVYGALGIVWPFAPMHMREALAIGAGNFSDTLHIALGVATEVIYLVALALAASALGKAFRVYSIATVVVLFAFGALTFRDAPRLSDGQPTPLIGVWERLNIGLFLAWVIVLAIALLWRRHSRGSVAPLHALPEPA